MDASLPHGVSLSALSAHRDRRGHFTEIYRESWLELPPPPQWNLVFSEATVLRGVHVHVRHWDYLVLAQGHALIGLRDLRRESPTFGRVSMIEMSGEAPASLFIPPGVAHGFYFLTAAMHLYGVSEYWKSADELGCRFDDADLAMNWPNPTPLLSERDIALPSLAELMKELDGAGPISTPG